MIVGTTLFKMDGSAYYTPSFGRGGLAATFSLEVRNINATPDVTVTVEHRNEEDTSWTTAGTFSTITAAGTTTLDVTNVKEIVRLKFAFDAGDASDAGIHFFLPAPAWRPYP